MFVRGLLRGSSKGGTADVTSVLYLKGQTFFILRVIQATGARQVAIAANRPLLETCKPMIPHSRSLPADRKPGDGQ